MLRRALMAVSGRLATRAACLVVMAVGLIALSATVAWGAVPA
ncbi:MAG: hypothetical protein ACXVRW_01370 [Solirubrobacteraceae bacterium]